LTRRGVPQNCKYQKRPTKSKRALLLLAYLSPGARGKGDLTRRGVPLSPVRRTALPGVRAPAPPSARSLVLDVPREGVHGRAMGGSCEELCVYVCMCD
jgi:hypothetical protein